MLQEALQRVLFLRAVLLFQMRPVVLLVQRNPSHFQNLVLRVDQDHHVQVDTLVLHVLEDTVALDRLQAVLLMGLDQEAQKIVSQDQLDHHLAVLHHTDLDQRVVVEDMVQVDHHQVGLVLEEEDLQVEVVDVEAEVSKKIVLMNQCLSTKQLSKKK